MTKLKLNSEISVDLPKLIESRLLVQANSGGGKSWAIRRLIEQCFGKVQIIVLDPEGEFTNLREKYDFVYAGKDADAIAEPRTAALLAKRLLELHASAIVDLYELNPQERKRFVRLFCEAMVNAQKELWHDCLVIIDEAHVFAPEKGESEAMGPVIDLATRGRKRGYCVVLATQRLPKLNKDAAAECNNKLIGRASQDIDRKRAAEELGFTTKEQVLSLRDLEPGEFYAFGPAISREVIKLTIGDVKVKPAPRGQSKHAAPPPTEKVKKILAQLADLPKEAAHEAQTIAELKRDLAQARREVLAAKKTPAAVDPKYIEQAVEWALKKRDKEWEVRSREAQDEIKSLRGRLSKISAIIGLTEPLSTIKPPKLELAPLYLDHKPIQPVRNWDKPVQQIDLETITGPEQKILNAIAWMESIGVSEPAKPAVAFLAGYTFGGGGFNNPCGSLRTKGLIEYRGGNLALTQEGRNQARVPEDTLTNEEMHNKVLSILPGPEKRLMVPLLAAHPNDMSNEELAGVAGYQVGSGGFNNPKGRLRTLELVTYPLPGRVRASDILFPL